MLPFSYAKEKAERPAIVNKYKEARTAERELKSFVNYQAKLSKIKDKTKLLELEKECNENDYESCVTLGLNFMENKRRNKARRFWTKACKADHFKACYNLGLLESKRKKRVAMSYYSKACEGEMPEACSNLAQMYFKKKKYDKTREFFGRACELESPQGCYNLGLFENHKGKKTAAYNAYEKSCLLKFKKACQQNIDIISQLKKECSLQKSNSCLHLGVHYYKKKNYDLAQSFYETSCKQKNYVACYNIGVMAYKSGNKKETGKYWQYACELKDHLSCLYAAIIRGDQQKKLKYLEPYTKACNQGYMNHCFNLTKIYSLAGDANASVHYLEVALSSGLTPWDLLEKSFELKALKEHPKYYPLIKKFKVN